MRKKAAENLLDWILQLLTALIVCLLLIQFVGQISYVRKNSMLPTLANDDVTIIEKLSPAFGWLKRGDIVVIRNAHYANEENDRLVKRIIAVAGDRVEIRNGEVLVNKVKLAEDYISGSATKAVDASYSDIIVPDGRVYVLGDNRVRGESLDSRTFGPVALDDIEGKVLLRIYPLDRFGTVK
jgi:signal peptidase I